MLALPPMGASPVGEEAIPSACIATIDTAQHRSTYTTGNATARQLHAFCHGPRECKRLQSEPGSTGHSIASLTVMPLHWDVFIFFRISTVHNTSMSPVCELYKCPGYVHRLPTSRRALHFPSSVGSVGIILEFRGAAAVCSLHQHLSRSRHRCTVTVSNNGCNEKRLWILEEGTNWLSMVGDKRPSTGT